MINLTKKTIFNSASLAFILLISTKLVSACASVICNNGHQSNVCSIDKNKIAAQWYFKASLTVFIIITILYFIRNRKGLWLVSICFLSLILPEVLVFINGDEVCDFFATKVAKQLFYFSLLPLMFQIISLFFQIKRRKLRLN